MSTQASVEEKNMASVRRAVAECWNKNDWSVGEDVYAPDVVVWLSPQPEPLRSRDAFKSVHAMLHATFPDHHITIDDMFAQGDRVAVRWTVRGTQKGEFFGFPPTGKRVEVEELTIFRIVDGKAQEIWHMPGVMAMMQQLELMPAGPPPRAMVMLMGAVQKISKLLPKRGVKR